MRRTGMLKFVTISTNSSSATNSSYEAGSFPCAPRPNVSFPPSSRTVDAFTRVSIFSCVLPRTGVEACKPSVSPFPLAPAAHLGVRDQLLRFWTSCSIRSHGSHRQARFSSRFFASTSSRFRLGNGGKWMGEPNTSKHRSEERSNRKEGVERGKRPMVQSSAPFGKGWETRTQPEGMR